MLKEYTNLKQNLNESNNINQELNNIKLKMERDYGTLQNNIQEEKNARNLALEKKQELEGML